MWAGQACRGGGPPTREVIMDYPDLALRNSRAGGVGRQRHRYAEPVGGRRLVLRLFRGRGPALLPYLLGATVLWPALVVGAAVRRRSTRRGSPSSPGGGWPAVLLLGGRGLATYLIGLAIGSPSAAGSHAVVSHCAANR